VIGQIPPQAHTGPAPAGAAERPEPGALAGLLRAALAPVICSALLLGLLSAWVITGGGGTITRVSLEITAAAVAAPPRPGAPAEAYLTIANLGGADRLIAVTTPDARRVVLVQHGGNPAGPGRTLAAVPIGAHSTVSLNPFSAGIVLIGPSGLTVGDSVPLTLTFAAAGRVTVQASVTPPGTP
jgi:copper(I)-binding protein